MFVILVPASFELMRKEQVKAIHEKQKSSSHKQKDEFDRSTLMEDLKDENKSNELDQPSSGNSEKSSLPMHTPMPRPVVPPGFANSTERSTGTKSLTHSLSAEVI